MSEVSIPGALALNSFFFFTYWKDFDLAFRLIPTKARRVESPDGTLGFHHSSIRSASADHDSPYNLPALCREARRPIICVRSPAGRRNHRATRAAGHANQLRVIVARAQHPVQTNGQAAGHGHFCYPPAISPAL